MSNPTTTPRIRFHVVSFGYGHGTPPKADLTIDVRDWFRDPHISPRLRGMTGRDPEVVANVMGTRGVEDAVDRLLALAAVFIDLDGREFTLAVGCVGGRHRSYVIAEQLTARAMARGWFTWTEHRDVDKPVLAGTRRTPGNGRGRQRRSWRPLWAKLCGVTAGRG